MPSTTIREPTGVSTPASGVLPSSLGVPGSGIGINSAAASASGPAGGASAALILEATENFITFLDALKLSFRAKDQLHPLLSEVIQAVNKVAPDFEDRGKIVQWLIRLNQMKATDELDDDQARELELDMNQAYQGFKSILSR